jgi:hypothetical protein
MALDWTRRTNREEVSEVLFFRLFFLVPPPTSCDVLLCFTPLCKTLDYNPSDREQRSEWQPMAVAPRGFLALF